MTRDEYKAEVNKVIAQVRAICETDINHVGRLNSLPVESPTVSFAPHEAPRLNAFHQQLLQLIEGAKNYQKDPDMQALGDLKELLAETERHLASL